MDSQDCVGCNEQTTQFPSRMRSSTRHEILFITWIHESIGPPVNLRINAHTVAAQHTPAGPLSPARVAGVLDRMACGNVSWDAWVEWHRMALTHLQVSKSSMQSLQLSMRILQLLEKYAETSGFARKAWKLSLFVQTSHCIASYHMSTFSRNRSSTFLWNHFTKKKLGLSAK